MNKMNGILTFYSSPEV